MNLEREIDRLYGLPLDEFVRGRDELAKRLAQSGDREAAARVKALRKPTVGAWALNQAVRRRRAETDALLATGERLRGAHQDLLSGGDPAVLRELMEEERSLTTALADCAEAIASETGKSGPALRDRVRATLHSAAVDEEAREELAHGRFVREREAVGLGPLMAAGPAPAGRSRAAPPRPQRASKRARPDAAAPPPEPPTAPPPDERIAEAERVLDEARAALTEAESSHAAALSVAESAREALGQAEEAEREARRVVRERWREVAKHERKLERLRPKR
ncbi:MAG: hypothetical protein QOH58_3326 [Thermoleophilaceae bacterium]|jgi:hypothetical protein|nr:hypothetical protein [Thermoleophilaceae bacterium]